MFAKCMPLLLLREGKEEKLFIARSDFASTNPKDDVKRN